MLGAMEEREAEMQEMAAEKANALEERELEIVDKIDKMAHKELAQRKAERLLTQRKEELLQTAIQLSAKEASVDGTMRSMLNAAEGKLTRSNQVDQRCAHIKGVPC